MKKPPAPALTWPQAINAIGLTDLELAQKLSEEGYRISRVTITDMRNGKGAEPRYSVGRRLLELAAGANTKGHR